MWPFPKKRVRDRERAHKDNNSLGNIMLRAGIITVEDLRRALEFQDSNSDHMLGEALVQVVEGLDKEIVEAFLAMQEIEDGHAGRQALAKVVELAKNRKKPLHDAHDSMVKAALCLNGD